jgi:hypothetical protein
MLNALLAASLYLFVYYVMNFPLPICCLPALPHALPYLTPNVLSISPYLST